MADMMLDRDNPIVLGAREEAKAGSPVDAMLDAVIERLKTRLVPLIETIERYHNRSKQYDLGERNAAVVVLAEGAKYAAAGLPGAAGLARKVRIVIVLIKRVEPPENAVHRLLEDIRLALHGESFAGSTGFVPVEEEFDDEEEGVGLWHISFEASLPAVPVKPQRSAGSVRLVNT